MNRASKPSGFVSALSRVNRAIGHGLVTCLFVWFSVAMQLKFLASSLLPRRFQCAIFGVGANWPCAINVAVGHVRRDNVLRSDSVFHLGGWVYTVYPR